MANPQTAKSSFTQFMQQPTRYIFNYMYHLLQKNFYVINTQHLFKFDTTFI